MAIDVTQFYQVFFEESAEHLANMEALLLGLDIGNPDMEDLNAIFRAAHSIKGSAGTFGFTDLAETTHVLENLLDQIRKQELQLQPAMVDTFLEAGDLLKAMLQGHQGQEGASPEAVADICERLRRLTTGAADATPVAAATEAAPGGPQTYDITFVPMASATHAQVANLLTELSSVGELEIISEPQADASTLSFWQLRLTTARPQGEFSEAIDFLAENGAWRVTPATPKAQEETAYGLFSDEAPAQEEAYGFFDPPAPPPADDDAYGFFVDPAALPAAAPATGPAAETADDAYGFFEPLPATPAAVPVAEEGEGYGLFVVPQPVATPASESVAPAVAPVAAKTSIKPDTSDRAAKAAPVSTGGDSSIRVNVEKVDQLINLVGELVITQAMLLQTVGQLGDNAPERLLNGIAQLERNTRDLQESVMSIRMLPISFVFSRFPRVVRDLSGKLGKQVELKTIGESTELDKSLIERIADPLTHLIRNSLDHGIETPENRVAAGKSPQGTITLTASHQGGNIVIEVGDDGRGLDRQKILAKARERGLPASDQMTDQEVFGLIFEAGFSTAEQVTDVSGRGVGMDVVRRNIQSMGGRVEIESMAGVGTRMTVRLPLTLAILDGMSVAVGNQIYIVPLSSVIESLQPRQEELKSIAKQGRVVQVRGEYLPIIPLHEVFGIQNAVADCDRGILIVLEADGIKAALLVDALVGQHQVVIKSLEANYRKVPGISGATIMGDGHVAMILDVAAIVGIAKQQRQPQAAIA